MTSLYHGQVHVDPDAAVGGREAADRQPRRQVAIELRAVSRELRLQAIERFFLGRPPGFFSVFTISGSTALISAAFATRLSPCRPR
jgi:hypothetical protein